ncbi:DUF5677 domain-containing protein [Georgenia yuyongxinii]|uniref:Uncharacterized protein n=1 Tax=Georgenia yuyongxinii TaxID=2589797 RepID=A0A552WUN4_9MICO|nr:DUF5677 domain-containing protein [Georgenia yuyongxinii]TRW46416.1 hypothetical protein FJ693_05675 [Georgenia yuyongxinii]
MESGGGKFKMKYRRKKRTTEPQFLTTFTLCAHVHELATAAVPLLVEGMSTVATPLVRSIYESALTAHWVAQAEDGGEAFVREDLRQRRNMRDTLGKAASETFRKGAEGIAHLDLEVSQTPDEDAARAFQKLCEDLEPGGTDAYAWYRFLSTMTHPSTLVTDQYLDEVDGELILSNRPKNPTVEVWMFLTVASMVWAGRAVTYMQRDSDDRRDYLRSVARQIGVEAELDLSQAYHLRHITARKKAAAKVKRK